MLTNCCGIKRNKRLKGMLLYKIVNVGVTVTPFHAALSSYFSEISFKKKKCKKKTFFAGRSRGVRFRNELKT